MGDRFSAIVGRLRAFCEVILGRPGAKEVEGTIYKERSRCGDSTTPTERSKARERTTLKERSNSFDSTTIG